MSKQTFKFKEAIADLDMAVFVYGVQPQKKDDDREDYGYGYKNRYGSYRGY